MSINIHGNTKNNHKKHWDTRGRTGTINKAGYRVFTTGSRSNVTRAYEHRLVMEDYIGRKLSQNEHVHHINGDKLDNAIDNLQLIDDSTHKKIHSKNNNFGRDRIGIPPVNKLSKQTSKIMYELLDAGVSGSEIAKKLEVSCSVVSKYNVYRKENNANYNS